MVVRVAVVVVVVVWDGVRRVPARIRVVVGVVLVTRLWMVLMGLRVRVRVRVMV